MTGEVQRGFDVPPGSRLGRHGTLRLLQTFRSRIGFAVVVDACSLEPPDNAAHLARDLEDVHAYAEAVLREHGVYLPTVLVVVGLSDGVVGQMALHLRQQPSAAATWFVPRADTSANQSAEGSISSALSIVEDLLRPTVGAVSFRATHEWEFQELVRGWSREDDLAVLRPLWSAIGDYPLFGRARADGEEPVDEHLNVWRNGAESAFREALRRCVDDGGGAATEIPTLEASERMRHLDALRISKMKVQNIGGIDEAEIEFGSHVTLVFGPNGGGKSSMTRALTLMLNDHQSRSALLFKAGSPAGEVALAEVPEGSEGAGPRDVKVRYRRVGYQRTDPSSDPQLKDLDNKELWEPRRSLIGHAVRDRLSVLANEDVTQVLEHPVNEAPFLRAVLPRPPREDALTTVLQAAQADDGLLAVTARNLDSDDALAAALPRLQQRELELRRAFLDAVREPVVAHLSNPLLREVASELAQLEQHGGWVATGRSRRAIERAASDTGRTESRPDQSLFDQLVRLERQLEALGEHAESRNEDETLRWLGASDANGPSDLERLFSDMIAATTRWRSPPAEVPARVARPLRELFGAVDLDALRLYRDGVARDIASLRERRQLDRERQELLRRLRTVELHHAVVAASVAATSWERKNGREWVELHDQLIAARAADASAEHRRSVRERILEVDRAIERVRGRRVDAPQVDEVRSLVEAELNRLICRYGTFKGSSADRDKPMRVELDGVFGDRFRLVVSNTPPGPPEEDMIASRDTRPTSTLSTGQKYQVGLAWMIAQRRLVQNSEASSWMGHRCLVLDDAGSSQDEVALAREALVLRQLAYAADERQQLQLILFTHHRRTAERYCELLSPPPGCELRFVELASAGQPPKSTLIPAWRDRPAVDWASAHDALRDALTFGRPEEPA
jgi:energy-coupling factor transporter ATP-binding protein EcfA2